MMQRRHGGRNMMWLVVLCPVRKQSDECWHLIYFPFPLFYVGDPSPWDGAAYLQGLSSFMEKPSEVQPGRASYVMANSVKLTGKNNHCIDQLVSLSNIKTFPFGL